MDKLCNVVEPHRGTVSCRARLDRLGIVGRSIQDAIDIVLGGRTVVDGGNMVPLTDGQIRIPNDLRLGVIQAESQTIRITGVEPKRVRALIEIQRFLVDESGVRIGSRQIHPLIESQWADDGWGCAAATCFSSSYASTASGLAMFSVRFPIIASTMALDWGNL